MSQKTITLVALNDTTTGCHNCVHRYGWSRESWKCSRTGYYTEVEMKHSGRCAKGGELLLWAPRRGMPRFIKAIMLFLGVALALRICGVIPWL
jgi:hypothetical protein